MSDEKETDDAAKASETSEESANATEAETVTGDAPATDAEANDAAAIARRVAALSDEDPEERKAREEERKLQERRAATKKKSGVKKSGLEVAASKKLSKIGTRAEPRRNLAVAADADPLLERTEKLTEWAKRNQKLVQIVGGAIAVGLVGIAGFLYFDHKREVDASVLLTQAVADDRGQIGEPPKDVDPDVAAAAGPFFKTFDERRDAALAKYREVESKFPKTGAAILARLSEGSLLLDKRDPDGAAAAFTDVRNSPLAAADQEVKGRSIEGLGFAYELKARLDPNDAAKHNDEALKTYKELENTVDVRGFKELAIYHQARLHEVKGEKDKAKELLINLRDRLQKPEETAAPGVPPTPGFPFLREVAMDRLRELDPMAAPKPGAGAPGRPPGSQLTPEQIRKLIEDAQRKQQQGGGAP